MERVCITNYNFLSFLKRRHNQFETKKILPWYERVWVRGPEREDSGPCEAMMGGLVPPCPTIQSLPPSLGRCVDGWMVGRQFPCLLPALFVHLANPFSICWSGVF